MGVRTCSAKAKILLGWETKIELKNGIKEFVKNFAQSQ
jgi:nucleoside-diphosphate-sugar epimerase